IRLELVDVFLLARAECMSRGGNARDGIDRQRVPIVRVGNVEIDDWNALLEHRRRVTERLRRRGVEDIGKSRSSEGVSDDSAVDVLDIVIRIARGTRGVLANHWRNVNVAVERTEAQVAARLVREEVRRAIGAAAWRAALCA